MRPAFCYGGRATGTASLLISFVAVHQPALCSQEKKAASGFEHIEAVLLALQKLMYMHRNSNSCFISHDGIGYVLQLCQKLQAKRCEFSDEAAAMLFDLTSKQAVTAVMEKMEGEESEDHRSAFKVFTESPGGVLPLCELYHVELHSPQGSVADAMIKEGVVWVGSHSRDHIEGGGEECEVCVTHVETGGHFWCQRYGGEDSSKLPTMYGSLKKMVRYIICVDMPVLCVFPCIV